jgi:hypothetical protein
LLAQRLDLRTIAAHDERVLRQVVQDLDALLPQQVLVLLEHLGLELHEEQPIARPAPPSGRAAAVRLPQRVVLREHEVQAIVRTRKRVRASCGRRRG